MQLIKVQHGSVIRARPNMNHQGVEHLYIVNLLWGVAHVARVDCKLDIGRVVRQKLQGGIQCDALAEGRIACALEAIHDELTQIASLLSTCF